VDVSIVIPFKFGAKYAFSSLLSCRLAMRGKNAEIVLCLDSPSDDERDLLQRQIRKAAAPVKLVENTGSGISAAINSGIDAASSEFILRHDIDDLMLPKRLDYCKEGFDRGFDFIFGSALRFPKPKRLTVPANLAEARLRCLYENPFMHPASAYTKKAIGDIGGYDPYFDGIEDFELWSRVLWSSCNIVTDQRLHVLYRKHEKQYSKSRNAKVTNLKRIEVFEKNRIRTIASDT
jgi:glycosyltransferase involved in cell wall biosynthesis